MSKASLIERLHWLFYRVYAEYPRNVALIMTLMPLVQTHRGSQCRDGHVGI